MTDMTPKDDESLGSFYMGRMRTPPEPRRLLPKGVLTGATLFAFTAIIWYAYPRGQEKFSGLDIPTISADKSVYKFKPENPGGMEVPHQDSTVFDPIDNRSADAARVEKLGAPPEEPVDKDAAISTAPIDKKMEKLNLESQLTTPVSEDTEKVIAPVVEEEPPATPEEKPAAVKETKPAEKPKPVKVEAKPVAKPVEKPAAAAAVTGGGNFIQLGSYKDIAAAKADWAVLQRKFPQTLGKMKMRTQRVDIPGKGTFNRLQAGASSPARAVEVCKLLKGSGTSCIVVH
jgi:cell division protein FtsN